jgi:hypothetical protein
MAVHETRAHLAVLELRGEITVDVEGDVDVFSVA